MPGPGDAPGSAIRPGSIQAIERSIYKAPIYVTSADQFVLRVHSNLSASSITLLLTVRFIDELSGKPDVFTFTNSGGSTNWTVTDTTGAGQSIFAGPMPFTGWLQSVVVLTESGSTPARGRLYVSIFLMQGTQQINSIWALLAASYYCIEFTPAWVEGSPAYIEDPLSGAGWRHSIHPSNPVANTDWTFTVGTNQRIKVFGVAFQDVVATATTQTDIVVTDGTNELERYQPSTAQIVGTDKIRGVRLLGGNGINTLSTVFEINIGDNLLPPGFTIGSSSATLANVTLSGIYIDVEEWIQTS